MKNGPAEGRSALVAALVALVDGGKPADAYALCEATLRVEGSTSRARAAKIYTAHLDLARGTKVDEHARFFTTLVDSNDGWERGHAHSGLGFVCLVKGSLEDALVEFERAEVCFEAAGAPLDGLKARMRRVSALHYIASSAAPEALLNAERLASSGLSEARSRGTEARGLVMSFAGALGAQMLASGRRLEALTFLKEAARAALALKTQTSASAFAQFQFGHALFHAGRMKDALAWLERAESAQRLLEPSARAATLVLLVRVHRARADVSAGWKALQRLKGLRIPNVERTAAAEALEEEILLLLEVFRVEDARELLNPVSPFQHSFLGTEVLVLDASAHARVQAQADSLSIPWPLERPVQSVPGLHWFRCETISGSAAQQEAEVLVDLLRQTVFFLRLRSGALFSLAQQSWRADSALGPTLTAIAGRVACGNWLPFDLLAAQELFSDKGRNAATARRTWYRVLDEWNALLAEAFPGLGKKASCIDLAPFARFGLREGASRAHPPFPSETSQ